MAVNQFVFYDNHPPKLCISSFQCYAFHSGINATLVLIVLLLAVPLQLYLNHYLNQTYTTPSTDGGTTSVKEAIKKGMDDAPPQEEEGIDEVRKKAMER